MRDLFRKIPWFQFSKVMYKTKFIKILFPLTLIVLIAVIGRHELQKVNIGRMIHELSSMPSHVVIIWSIASFFAVSAMSAYDFLIRKQFKLDLGWKKIYQYAWIANSFNNMIGFAGVAGVAMRTLLYKKSNVPIKTMGAAVLFLSPIILVGLSLLGCFVLIGVFPVEPVFKEHAWLKIGVWGIACYLPLFFLMQRSSHFAKWFNKGQSKLPWKIVIASLGSSVLEWVCAGALFWLFAYYYLSDIPFAPTFGIYIVAAIAGVISMAPGGIGTFDLIALLGLKTLGVTSSDALTILFLFRIFYFVIPWLIGLLLMSYEWIPPRKKMIEKLAKHSNVIRKGWSGFWNWPSRPGLFTELLAWVLEKVVLISGVILLLSGILAGPFHLFGPIEPLWFIPITAISRPLLILIGILLIVISHGMILRTRLAIIWAGALWLISVIFSSITGMSYRRALLLLIVAGALWVIRSQFDRENAAFSLFYIWISIILAFIISIIYHISVLTLHRHIIWQSPLELLYWDLFENEHMLMSLIVFLGGFVIVLSMFILRPHRYNKIPSDTMDMDKLTPFIKKEETHPLTHLLYLGDKYFFWAQNDQVLIPYSRVRRKLIVLGDPIGNKQLVGAAIQEFQRYASRYASTVVFYQATPEYLSIYHENGYKFFKLGEEALVPLNMFSLSGKRNQNLRTALNKSDREGLIFEVLTPPYDVELLSQLRLVSDDWLGGRAEKSFSLGWYSETYIQRAPLALLRNSDGKILAFATLAASTNPRKVITIDLMRHLNNTPNGTMDVLFVRMMIWAKQEDYEYFNLGMSPLSSVGVNKNAHRQEKIAHLVFRHGGHWYGFEGLRRYKEKFNPEWQTRYLAYPAKLSLPVLTLDLIQLISRCPERQNIFMSEERS
ncbi:bifunctional lysylphosphatidylglycerol flippase/synthetase MprF [Paenibacillus sp. ACRRY]|uniref:bifunctional lysylphosphatidylglycerol flippase/synthetase MprF n=1 Tax=Paenibacillus sp. ACRRY TaxID=2918208 RepID=UPI001EF71B21|nr:bifunctional lysylphosphatidylglycerol flippase/synthetase MprF [Paenibacillus sp. ACRRY]MCG7381738.1 bifunctional lysylphosphatidylglycerol flippase/synthetase MprF [Paenibacillus sp. ACRRY]